MEEICIQVKMYHFTEISIMINNKLLSTVMNINSPILSTVWFQLEAQP